MTNDQKVRENRARRKADRQGLRLMKSRSRDPDAMDFGLYGLADITTNGLVHPALAGRWSCALTIEEVEDWLSGSADEKGDALERR